MNKRLAIVTCLFALLELPGAAQAYCCMNEAICVAVCGDACCGDDLATPSASTRSNLGEIPIKQLRAESRRAGRDNPSLQSILQSEIASRSTRTKTKLKASSVTRDRYCCWNPAICNAVCGSACCGSKLATASDSSALGKVSVEKLRVEAGKAKDKNADLHQLLQAELKRRSAPAPVRIRQSVSTADRYCCWNPAICNAVCGSECCGSKLATASDSSALGKVSIEKLRVEAGKAKTRNAELHRLLQAEIDRRSASRRR